MKNNFLLLIILTTTLTSCLKYLDKIPDPSLAVPDTVEGLQELMDNNLVTENSTPGFGQLGSDDYLVTDSAWRILNSIGQNAYIWQTGVYQGDGAPSWRAPYTVIYYCNVVLSQLPFVKTNGPADIRQYENLKGTALFTRAFQYYHLEETYGQPYRPASAIKDLGIPLRLNPEPSQKAGRSTVQQVYGQMITDLRSALPMLPDSLSYLHRNRPCKAAALALLSRIYLGRQQYDSARICADNCLSMYDKLVDYNSLNAQSNRPFSADGNDEVLYQCTAVSLPGQTAPSALVDTTLYQLYAGDDLRKTIFFHSAASGTGHYVKTGYSGKSYLFSGLALDEVYLTRAECWARAVDKDKALRDLNTLLSLRWKTGTFQPYTAATADQALALILTERRKETLFRETRWADLRRLNQDIRFAVTLRRTLNSQTYILPPGDLRYAYPIPEEEIRLGGIEQNPR